MRRVRSLAACALLSPFALTALCAQQPPGARDSTRQPQTTRMDQFEREQLNKRLTDLQFFLQLGPEMIVRKVLYSGEDQFLVPAYLFSPKDTLRKHAALIMVHGGVHGDFETLYVPHVRSLVAQGYVIIAPEYRGSTGYGRAHYDAIDYGGKEVEDALLAREFLETYVPWADLDRLGIIGWSHGGFITLHSIFRHPEYFKVAVANVPVADLPTRIKTHSASYQRLFAEQKGFGGTLEQNPQAYWDRSPIAHIRELKIPLLVHTASNDRDVFIVENHNMRDSMVAAGMDKKGLYHYKEWQDPPGGHEFNRVQSAQGKESWTEILDFLKGYLKP